MLYMSQTRVSRQARKRPRVKRPIVSLDNPVKRYLGNRSVGPGLWEWSSRSKVSRNVLRPAF